MFLIFIGAGDRLVPTPALTKGLLGTFTVSSSSESLSVSEYSSNIVGKLLVEDFRLSIETTAFMLVSEDARCKPGVGDDGSLLDDVLGDKDLPSISTGLAPLLLLYVGLSEKSLASFSLNSIINVAISK